MTGEAVSQETGSAANMETLFRGGKDHDLCYAAVFPVFVSNTSL
jgi:hypothetical protein